MIFICILDLCSVFNFALYYTRRTRRVFNNKTGVIIRESFFTRNMIVLKLKFYSNQLLRIYCYFGLFNRYITHAYMCVFRHIKDDCTQRLFCWKQWVKYIECRRVTLARFNYCMDQKYYKSCVSSKQNFIDYWEKTKPLYTIEKSRKKFICIHFSGLFKLSLSIQC